MKEAMAQYKEKCKQWAEENDIPMEALMGKGKGMNEDGFHKGQSMGMGKKMHY